MKNYSFIIPHRNSPDLLNRCLDSIPQREDIEIIVVDDNSDADKKPQVARPDVKLIYIDAEHTKGAGRARNYALKEAKGKWLVFADCDDFFVSGFLDILDQYKDQDLEVVYYNAKAADTHTLEPMPQLLQRHNSYFERYDGGKDAEDLIRFRIHSPWWKMVKRDFVEKYQIVFEEVPKGNDIFFTYQVGFFVRKMAVEREPLYVYTFNPNGISNGKKNKDIYVSQFRNVLKSTEFYKFVGHCEWIHGNQNTWFRILKYSGPVIFMQTLIDYWRKYNDLQATKMEYVNGIKSRIEQK